MTNNLLHDMHYIAMYSHFKTCCHLNLVEPNSKQEIIAKTDTYFYVSRMKK